MEYQAITGEDTEEIITVIERDLTHGSAIGEEIREHVAAGEYFGVKAVEDGVLRGFFTYKKGIGLTFPHPEVEEKLRELSKGDLIFSGDALVVLGRNSRHRGLASEICRRSRDQALAMGGKYMIHELWVYPNGKIPAWKPVSEFGPVIFQEEMPGFYKDLGNYGMECPICGRDCKCGAVIWLQRLGQKSGEDA